MYLWMGWIGLAVLCNFQLSCSNHTARSHIVSKSLQKCFLPSFPPFNPSLMRQQASVSSKYRIYQLIISAVMNSALYALLYPKDTGLLLEPTSAQNSQHGPNPAQVTNAISNSTNSNSAPHSTSELVADERNFNNNDPSLKRSYDRRLYRSIAEVNRALKSANANKNSGSTLLHSGSSASSSSSAREIESALK